MGGPEKQEGATWPMQAARCVWEPRPAPAEGAYRVSSLEEEASAVVEEIGARRIPPATSLAATTTGEEWGEGGG